jgi:predicted HTH transcriptional regulator
VQGSTAQRTQGSTRNGKSPLTAPFWTATSSNQGGTNVQNLLTAKNPEPHASQREIIQGRYSGNRNDRFSGDELDAAIYFVVNKKTLLKIAKHNDVRRVTAFFKNYRVNVWNVPEIIASLR